MMNNLFSIDNRMLVYGLNKSYTDIFCFSTTRHKGFSSGSYASFNCNHYCGDNPADVEKNKELLISILPQKPDDIILPHQVHGTSILDINKDFLFLGKKERDSILEGVDAVTTNVPGLCLCISTADCIPVLLYDCRNKAIAAIHAGWRGTVERIVEKTLFRMCMIYGTNPEDVRAVIGPGISLLSFEVGNEVYRAFASAGFDMNVIARKYDKWHIDLWEANRLQLVSKGVKASNIEVCGICTYINHEDFFSARRLGINSGRIITGIVLNRNK